MGPKLKTGHQSCQIELKGEGCREYERLCPEKNWSEFLDFFMFDLRAVPTRFDLSIDDYEGKHATFDLIKQKLENKMFISPFKSKVVTIHGSNENGYTLELGKYGLSRMLAIYEKHKEQQSKNKKTDQPYWLRFEMRYFHQVAHEVCLSLLELNDEELKTQAFSLLYKMLDIKEDIDPTQFSNLNKVKTIQWWNDFLESAPKAKIEKNTGVEKNYDNYNLWIERNTSLYFLKEFILSFKDEYDYTTKMLKLLLNALENIEEKKIKKLNRLLKIYHFPKQTLNDLVLLKQEVKESLKRRELPF